MKPLLIFTAWAGLSLTTLGFLNADWRVTVNCAYNVDSPRKVRDDFAMNVFWALLPPLWFESPFLTGFWQYGWTLKNAPVTYQECESYK